METGEQQQQEPEAERLAQAALAASSQAIPVREGQAWEGSILLTLKDTALFLAPGDFQGGCGC